MKALEYSNENHINIIPQQDFEDLVYEVFNVIATNLSKSLGPLGSSATILNGGLVSATKDGYQILKNYSFNNLYKKMIYNLIKAPCERLNNTVGDGTTTAIALTNAIFQAYKQSSAKLEEYYKLPRELNKAWDDVTEDIIDRIKKVARPIDPEDYETIYNLAYVVSNGNEDISTAIADAYRTAKSPAIKMKDSPSNKSYLEAVNGFEFPCNAIDSCYVRNQDLTANEDDVRTILFDFTVDTDTFNGLLVPLNDVMRAMDHKLIVIAPAYDKYMCETVLGQYVNYEHQKYRELNMILCQYNAGKLASYQLQDFAVVLGSKTITQELAKSLIEAFEENGVDRTVEQILEDPSYTLTRCIGSAKSLLVSCKNGCIFDVSGIEEDDRYQETLAVAQVELDDILAHTNFEQQSYAAKVYDARSRILQLQMKNYIYYVGANSELQKQILYDSIEDVIKCLRSATKTGVVCGCQISVIKAAQDIIKEINVSLTTIMSPAKEKKLKLNKAIASIILNGCLSVYQQVLMGPNGTGIIKSIPGWAKTEPTEDGINELKANAAEKLGNIIIQSIDRGEVWDVETEQFNPNIITSAETDIMVLTAANELIKILTSGNQCVFVDSSINESHQDTMEVYV